MKGQDEGYTKAMAEASDLFAAVGKIVEKRVSGGATEIDLVDTLRESRIEIDIKDILELKLYPVIPIVRFLPWHCWYPWRPLWCWWWHRHYPHYHSHHWWWCGCHCHYPGHIHLR